MTSMKLDTLAKWTVVIALMLAFSATCRTFGQTNPVVTLLANHYGHKEYDDPSGYYTFINYTSVVSMQFNAQLPSKINSSIYESRSANITGYINFIAHAEDHYFGDVTINDYSVSTSYSLPGQSLYIDFLASDGSVNWIGTPLPSGSDPTQPQIQGLVYVGGISIMTNFIAMPDPFDFDLDDRFPGPAMATVTGNGSSFSGLVEDASTGNPLVAATVVIGGQTLTTDASGKFFAPLLPPGSLAIQITKAGYLPYQASKTLPPFSAIQQPFPLNPAPNLIVVDANPNYLGSTLLPQPITSTLLTTLGNASSTRYVAAADGITKLVLQVRSSTPGAVLFDQSGGINGILAEVDGSPLPASGVPTSSVGGQQMAFALYTVPDQTSPGGAFINLLASFQAQGGSAPVALTPWRLQLIQTPVVLVHGLWDRGAVWDSMRPVLNDDNINFTMAVYYDNTWSSAAPFEHYRGVVVNQIQQMLTTQRAAGIAVTRADVVAHGMGGILTRMDANNSDNNRPDNYGAGYIRRVITIDTPHWGATPAQFLFAEAQDIPVFNSETAVFGFIREVPAWT